MVNNQSQNICTWLSYATLSSKTDELAVLSSIYQKFDAVCFNVYSSRSLQFLLFQVMRYVDIFPYNYQHLLSSVS